MPLGTTYISDQVATVTASGTISNNSVAATETALGAGNYVTPTEGFSIGYNGVTITGYKDVPIPVDAAFKAFLVANAPVEDSTPEE